MSLASQIAALATRIATEFKSVRAAFPTADTLSGATTTGKAVMKASSTTAARTAIGAGTSSLVLGTAAGTAADGAATQALFNGVRGSKWWYGVGSPGTISGSVPQDMYLDTSNGDVWQL